MNPWAVILALIGIACVIFSYKGTQDNLISAVLNRPYGNAAGVVTGVAPSIPGAIVGPNGQIMVPNSNAKNPLEPNQPAYVNYA